MKVILRRYNAKKKRQDIEEVEVTCLDIETELGTFYIDLNSDGGLNIGDNVTVRPAADETIDMYLD